MRAQVTFSLAAAIVIPCLAAEWCRVFGLDWGPAVRNHWLIASLLTISLAGIVSAGLAGALTKPLRVLVQAAEESERASGGGIGASQVHEVARLSTVLVGCNERLVACEAQRAASQREAQETKRTLIAWAAHLERQTLDTTTLNEIAEFLHRCWNSSDLFEAIGSSLPRLFPGSSGILYIRGDDGRLWPASTWGGQPEPCTSFAAPQCWALKLQASYVSESSARRSACEHVSWSRAGTNLCVPLGGQWGQRNTPLFGLSHEPAQQACGVLSIQNAWIVGEREHIKQAIEHLALTAAQHICLALTKLRVQEQLQDQAIRDPLTGLYNRRYMIDVIEREMSRAARESSSLSIVMLDIDHFKQVNDVYGHVAADKLLTMIGKFLLANTRRADTVCRFGGEEFLVIMPGTSPAASVAWAEHIREAIKDVRIEDTTLRPVSCSLGVASFPEDAQTGENLIRAADVALYGAKRAGRDRVLTCSGLGFKAEPAEVAHGSVSFGPVSGAVLECA